MDLTPAQPPAAALSTREAPLSVETAARIAELLTASVSESTRRATRSDWACFSSWASDNGRRALPASPETVAAYVAHLEAEGKKVSTIKRRVATISKAHRSQAGDAPNPCRAELVRGTIKGIATERKEGTGTGAAELGRDHALLMLGAASGDDPRSMRDRALVMVLFATAMRRAEIAALEVSDIDGTDPRGLVLTIRSSKTDQTGKGREVSLFRGSNPRTCPVRLLLDWMEHAEISDGFVFRSIGRDGTVRESSIGGKGISRAVKAMAKRAGMDPEKVSPHGFRAGHVSARLIAGHGVGAIMDTTGHRSAAMVKRYDRASKRFRHNATAALGL